MKVRLFHRGARLVLVVRRRSTGDETWWSPHLAAPDWGRIFDRQLHLLGLPAEPGGPANGRSMRLGEINWHAAARWSIITLRVSRGSEVKRDLIAAALLKAARYARAAA